MKAVKSISIFLTSILVFKQHLISQTIGANAAYNFMKLPASAQLAALGSVNVSVISNDASIVFHNPALLKSALRRQLAVSFNSLYSSIKNYQLLYTHYYEPLQTNFAVGVHFLNYGNITETDASGNVYGNVKPMDYVVQLSASRKYLQHWQYGITTKFIHSSYGIYRSSAIAMDAGVLYSDSTHQWQASLLFKNMGAVVKRYIGTRAEDLPFDVQAGVSKKLAKAPLQFSLALHHLHRFNILYKDTTFNNQIANASNNNKSFTVDKLFNHFVFSIQVFLRDKIELTIGYNHLRRNELSINNTPNGLTGFSLGTGVLLKKMQIRYARSYYQNNTAINQLGLNVLFHQF